MGGFQTPSSGGIKDLSALNINVSKDWNAKQVKNLADGVASQDAVTLAQVIYMTGAVNRTAAVSLASLDLDAVMRAGVAIVEDHSGGAHSPIVCLAVPIPTEFYSTNNYLPIAVDGFVSHQQTPPVDTDETAAANNSTPNDMDLLPALLTAAGDGSLFGLNAPFDSVVLIVGQVGIGTYQITWKYWNGTSFVPATILYNDADFKTVGIQRVTIKIPNDWAMVSIGGINAYWLKAEANGGTMTQQPLGTQVWIGQF